MEIDATAAPTPEPMASLDGAPLSIHDHLCVFHRGPAQGESLLREFLREGVQARQRVLGMVDATRIDGYRDALAPQGDETGPLLELTDPASSHLRTGRFDPDQMMGFWEEWGEANFGRDRIPFARIAADMGWACPYLTAPFISDLMSYEARFNVWARENPQITVCLYDLDIFGGEVILPAIRVHPKMWVDGVVVENPYYLDAADLSAPEHSG